MLSRVLLQYLNGKVSVVDYDHCLAENCDGAQRACQDLVIIRKNETVSQTIKFLMLQPVRAFLFAFCG